jgi:HSP20 family protein
MERMRRDFDRYFESSVPRVYRQRARAFPAVNIWTDENEGVVVTAELPGIAAEDINLSVTGDTLTISGTRAYEDEIGRENYHRREQRFGKFSRDVQLPFAVDNGQVLAKLNKGVLWVNLPRAEASKPKQIAIKAG